MCLIRARVRSLYTEVKARQRISFFLFSFKNLQGTGCHLPYFWAQPHLYSHPQAKSLCQQMDRSSKGITTASMATGWQLSTWHVLLLRQ